GGWDPEATTADPPAPPPASRPASSSAAPQGPGTDPAMTMLDPGSARPGGEHAHQASPPGASPGAASSQASPSTPPPGPAPAPPPPAPTPEHEPRVAEAYGIRFLCGADDIERVVTEVRRRGKWARRLRGQEVSSASA